MNRKTKIAISFASIIMLAQLTVMTPPVAADEDYEGIIIKLSNDENQQLDKSIEKLSGSSLYDTIVAIRETSSNGYEFELSGLMDIADNLKNYFDSNGYSDDVVLSLLDLIKTIISIIIFHLTVDIPVTVAELIYEDIENLIESLVKVIDGIISIITQQGIIAGFFSIVQGIAELRDLFEQLPTTREEFKQYLLDKFKIALTNALKAIIKESMDVFWEEYLQPAFGYVGFIASEIYGILTNGYELIEDGKVLYERCKIIFKDLPDAFKAFREVPDGNRLEKLQKLFELIEAIKNAYSAAVAWGQDIVNGDCLYVDIAYILNHLLNLFNYCFDQNLNLIEFWKNPVKVTGSVTVKDDAKSGKITVYFEDPDQDASVELDANGGSFELYYKTEMKEAPYTWHTINVVATNEATKKTQTRNAFSDGIIDVDFVFIKSRSVSKTVSPTSILRTKILTLVNIIDNLFMKVFYLKDLLKEHSKERVVC